MINAQEHFDKVKQYNDRSHKVLNAILPAVLAQLEVGCPASDPLAFPLFLSLIPLILKSCFENKVKEEEEDDSSSEESVDYEVELLPWLKAVKKAFSKMQAKKRPLYLI